MATITQTVTPYTKAPNINDSVNFENDVSVFLSEINSRVEETNNQTTQMNEVRDEVNSLNTTTASYATSASSSSAAASASSLLAQGYANFQGIWSSKGYSVGQSVSISDTRYICTVTHTVAQNPTTTTGYWQTAVYLGAVGELLNPLCDLDFQSSLYVKAGTGAVTFTRASGETGIDMYGNLVTAGVDTTVFNENGLQLRESSTNLWIYSEDLARGGTYKATILSDAILSPDGITMADKIITDTNLSSVHTITKNFSFTSSLTYTISCYAKAGELSNFRMYGASTAFSPLLEISVNLANGEITKLDTGTVGKVEYTNNGWYRISITGTATSTTSGSFFVGIDKIDGDGVSGIYLYGLQLEEKSFATPYIPTTTTAVTRAPQFCTLPAKYNMPSPTEGTIFIEFSKPYVEQTGYNILVSTRPSNENRFKISVTYLNKINVYLLENNIPLISYTSTKDINLGILNRLCFSWKNNIYNLYLNGIQISTGTLTFNGASMLGTLFIGRESDTIIRTNIDIKKFKTYQKALSPTAIALL